MSVDTERLRELAAEVVAEAFEEAELEEAKKKSKGKGGKKGSLPGPIIGYLMKKGVIGKGRKFKGKKKTGKAFKKDGYSDKMTRLMKGRRKASVAGMVRYRRR